MPTLKITGVDEKVVEFVRERSESLHFKGQAEYLRNLIREDMAKATAERRTRLRDIVAPLHERSREAGYTDGELLRDIEAARDEVRSINASLPEVRTIHRA